MPNDRPTLDHGDDDGLERAQQIIANQPEGMTFDQVEAQRNLWIISASEWEARLTKAQARIEQDRETIDRLRSALERLDRNFDLLLARKPVRDVAETKAEVSAALTKKD